MSERVSGHAEVVEDEPGVPVRRAVLGRPPCRGGADGAVAGARVRSLGRDISAESRCAPEPAVHAQIVVGSMQRGGAAIPSGTCVAARRDDIDLVAADSGRMAVNLVCGCSRKEVASGRRPARTRRDWRPEGASVSDRCRKDVGAIVL